MFPPRPPQTTRSSCRRKKPWLWPSPSPSPWPGRPDAAPSHTTRGLRARRPLAPAQLQAPADVASLSQRQGRLNWLFFKLPPPPPPPWLFPLFSLLVVFNTTRTRQLNLASFSPFFNTLPTSQCHFSAASSSLASQAGSSPAAIRPLRPATSNVTPCAAGSGTSSSSATRRGPRKRALPNTGTARDMGAGLREEGEGSKPTSQKKLTNEDLTRVSRTSTRATSLANLQPRVLLQPQAFNRTLCCCDRHNPCKLDLPEKTYLSQLFASSSLVAQDT